MPLPFGFDQRIVSTSGGEMSYAATQEKFWGPERTHSSPLVFFHGFGGGSSSYEWSKVYPAFASDYRVLAPDLLGWWRSAHPP